VAWCVASALTLLTLSSSGAAYYAFIQRNKARDQLARNYRSNAANAINNNDWLRTLHFLAKTAREKAGAHEFDEFKALVIRDKNTQPPSKLQIHNCSIRYPNLFWVACAAETG
jgi:hypothetical protein